MRDHTEKAGRDPEPVLTAKDLGRPAPPPGEGAAARPGEGPAVRPGEAPTRENPVETTGGRDGAIPDRPLAKPRTQTPPQPLTQSRPEAQAQPLTQSRPEAQAQPAPPGQAPPRPPRPEGPPVGVPVADRVPEGEEEPLLGAAEADRYRSVWGGIQGRFVDDPREAVRSADTLVTEVMQTFAGRLSEHRSGLEKQWDRGEQVATEDLRQALRAYRSLVNRLLDI